MFKLLASLAALSAACALPAVASAAPAQVTANVNLRTGPSTQYYPILVLPAGVRVEVYGCLAGYTWCDVSWGGNRGWISSRYLSTFYYGPSYRPRPARPVPSVTFSFGYWDNHYVGRPWYRDRPRHDDRPDPRPGWGGPGWGGPGPGWGGPRPPREERPGYGWDGPRPPYEGRPWRPDCRPGDFGPDCRPR